MARTVVKRAYRYRFYPTEAQRHELLRTFGCVRKVYNLALEARARAWLTEQRRVNYTETSAMLTAWKKTDELAFLGEVSSVPLQQALRHLHGAFTAFFDKRAKYPRFKSRKKSRQSAEYTRSGFTYRDGLFRLVKMREPLSIVWSRPLPEGAQPSTVTVSRDCADRWFVSILSMRSGTARAWRGPNASWPARRRARTTATRPDASSPASPRASPTAGGITCTSSPLDSSARTERS